MSAQKDDLTGPNYGLGEAFGMRNVEEERLRQTHQNRRFVVEFVVVGNV